MIKYWERIAFTITLWKVTVCFGILKILTSPVRTKFRGQVGPRRGSTMISGSVMAPKNPFQILPCQFQIKDVLFMIAR